MVILVFQGESEEYIPLREYLLRHDKAIFWVLESMIPFGNHPAFLFFLGWMLPPKPAFMKLTTTPVGKTVNAARKPWASTNIKLALNCS